MFCTSHLEFMINEEILNITSKASFSGQHRNFTPTESVVSNVHTCRRKTVREGEGSPRQGHQVILGFLNWDLPQVMLEGTFKGSVFQGSVGAIPGQECLMFQRAIQSLFQILQICPRKFTPQLSLKEKGKIQHWSCLYFCNSRQTIGIAHPKINSVSSSPFH